jgi:pimeloyl-ACP methyl ester carboxylesterase
VTPLRIVAVAVLAGGMLLGCASVVRLLEARDQMQRLPAPCVLRGALNGAPQDSEVFVVAIPVEGTRPVDFHAGRGEGGWWLIVPRERYRIAAFADLDADRKLGPDEPAALAIPEACSEGRSTLSGEIPLVLSESTDLPFAIDLSDPDLDVAPRLGPASIGEIASLDDERFSSTSGDRGLWLPIAFMQDPGGGLFLLEKYDPKRVPVLFVHGMAGAASQFRELIAGLDRERFQPWVVQYPSALRLELVADALRLGLDVLHDELGFTRLVVVAHSMGGLVARALLNDLDRARPGYRVELFATLATPWLGHEAAAVGVERSPVVIPAWRDLKPGSDFLTALFATALSEDLRWDLYFSFEGGRRRRGLGGANDGVVTVASQLAPVAQEHARRVRGFPESHTSILSSPAVSAALNQALAGM